MARLVVVKRGFTCSNKSGYIMPKINVEIISLFFHHTSFFAVYSTNSVTLGRKSVARKKRMTRGKTARQNVTAVDRLILILVFVNTTQPFS